MKKIISGTFYALFIALLLAIAGLFLASMLPIPGNIEIKIVKSGSMEPTILTGSVVVVKPQASYAKDEVITFGADTQSQIPTTHRIIDVQGNFTSLAYVTKGDANEEQDQETVAPREIIGKVVLAVPYLGYILDFARQPIGFTLMIGIPAAIIILDEIIRIIRELRGMHVKKRDDEEGPTDTGSHSGNSNSRPTTYDEFVEHAMKIQSRVGTRNIDGIRARTI